MSDSSQSILIVGAGVFGLSTALFLSRRGYKDVTVIDRCPFDVNHYNPDQGADGASADINKVFRTGYGNRFMYEQLAYKALPIWQEWTKAVHESKPEDLPAGLTPEDSLLVQCGVMRLGEGKEMGDYYKDSLSTIVKQGLRDRVYVLNDADDYEKAKLEDERNPGMHWRGKLNRYDKLLGGNIHGMMDMDSGFTRADKASPLQPACVWALHLCKQAGVKFILGDKGAFGEFIKSGSKVLGVRTKDGIEHSADKTIVAAGGWTASIVPEVSSLLETTGGSLAFIDIPPHRKDLLKRFGPEEFCGWSLKLEKHEDDSEGSYRGMGGFPADPNGRLKFGFRAIKYTNFETLPSGKRISVPRTRYSANPVTNIPKDALEAIKNNIMAVYPELAEIGITGTRICWYTDSIDNHFVGDYVPGTDETLFVASGGSGHGFKFLPVFGEHFVNQLEKKADEFTPYWKWRSAVPGQKANGLEEGEEGPRVLDKAPMASKEDWRFGAPTLDIPSHTQSGQHPLVPQQAVKA